MSKTTCSASATLADQPPLYEFTKEVSLTRCLPSYKNDVISPTICCAPLGRELTRHQLARLGKLGLSTEDYGFFVDTFVGHQFDFSIKYDRPDGGWSITRKTPLTNSHVIHHLEGDYWVATGCRWNPVLKRHVTPYVVLDLDNNDGSASLVQAFDAMLEGLGKPSFVVQSSATRGIHAYYLLEVLTELHTLRHPEAAQQGANAGLVISRLRSIGADEQSGALEVYPRGQYLKRGTQNRIRLPFGKGSWLLDTATLDKLTRGGVAANLSKLREMLADGDIRIVGPHDWMPKLDCSPIDTTPSVPQLHRGKFAMRAGCSEHVDRDAEVMRILEEGIPGPGTQHGIVSSIGFHWRRQGVPHEVAVAQIQSWLADHHNNQSRTFNRCPAAALKEATEAVSRVYDRNRGEYSWVPLPPLSRFEVDSIAKLFWGNLDDTVSPSHRYKRDMLAFFLLRKAKQYVLTRGPEWRSGSIAIQRAIWPDQREPRFVIQAPYTLRTSLPGISRDTECVVWKNLKDRGLFIRTSTRNTFTHQAERYCVSLDFDAYNANSAHQYWSLPAALDAWHVNIAEQYSKYYARLLRKQTRAIAEVVQDSVIVAHIRNRLGAADDPANSHFGPPLVRAQFPAHEEAARMWRGTLSPIE